MTNTQTKSLRATTGKTRVFYAKNLLTPDEKESYGLCVLIPKTDTKTVNDIKAMCEAFKADPKAQGIWGSKFLANFKSPLRDGDTERDTDKMPDFKGHWFINANTYTKPGVVDAQMQPVLNAQDIYPGCFVRISVTPGAFNKDGNKGIKLWLGNVQKLADGERIGGGFAAPTDDFTAVEEDFLS